MENRFKSQISKILQATLNSCRRNNISDVSNHRNPHRLIDLFSPKPQPQSSTTHKLKARPSRFVNAPIPSNSDCRNPHSVSPVHKKTSKRDRKKKPHHRRRTNSSNFSSITDNYYYNWWSSDEADDQRSKTTLFSRRSVSSDSDESLRGKRKEGDVVAVAKESNDPYEDFKASMVDMIVEKEIFGVEELEKLVECFLSLNSEEHHKVIFEVFAEIWEILIEDSGKKERICEM